MSATSVDAERAFSRGRLTVSRLRHSLSDASVRANTVLGSWAGIPGLVDEKEMIALLADKKGKRRASGTTDADEANAVIPDDSEGVSQSASSGIEDDALFA